MALATSPSLSGPAHWQGADAPAGCPSLRACVSGLLLLALAVPGIQLCGVNAHLHEERLEAGAPRRCSGNWYDNHTSPCQPSLQGKASPPVLPTVGRW